MRHDPEDCTASYLGGELTRRARTRFERHLVDCEDCWREVNAARAGRMLAESLREAAPAQLRERVRAIVSLPPAPSDHSRQQSRQQASRLPERPEQPLDQPPDQPPQLRTRRPSPYLVGAAVAVAGVVVLLFTTVFPLSSQDRQPAPIAAAAALFRTGVPATPNTGPSTGPNTGPSTGTAPVRRIADFDWTASASRDLGGVPATVHSYAGPAGRRLLVITSREPMPRATGARGVAPAPSWIATVNGATMVCADRAGVFWLTVAATNADARAASRTLGLTTK